MRRQIAKTLREAAVLLMLSVFAVSLAACSDSATPTSAPDSGPEAAQFTTVEGEVSATVSNIASTGNVLPTSESVNVSSSASTVPENRTERLDSPAALSAQLAADETSSDTDAAPVTSEQMVAAFEDVLIGIYEETLPSVVYLRVANPARERLRDMPGIPEGLLWSAGSGFVWDDEGHIVTNHHVVEDVLEEPSGVTVFFSDSTQAKATVVGSDPHSDLAVIKLEEVDRPLVPALLGDSGEVKVGQLSVAIGAPFGQEFTMTSGIVSAVGRNITGQANFSIPEVIQTDSAINPGNSGGPLLNRLGQVIGINTQIISSTGNFSGVGMAVPVNIAKRVVPPLIEEGEFNYPWLGVKIISLNSAYAEELGLAKETKGALITEVVEDSPAHKAGLRESESNVEIDGVQFPAGGDIIIAIGLDQIVGSSELIAYLTYHNSPGDVVTFTVLQDGEQKEVEVTLGRRPESLE